MSAGAWVMFLRDRDNISQDDFVAALLREECPACGCGLADHTDRGVCRLCDCGHQS